MAKEVKRWTVEQRDDAGKWRAVDEPVYAANYDDAYVCARLCYPVEAAHGAIRVRQR